MTREEKQKAIDALKISVPVRVMTQEEFNDYIQAINQVMDWLEQEPNYNSVNSLVESKLKNPKAKTFDILHFIADNAGLSTYEAIEKAYIMGASGQEPCEDAISREDLIQKLYDDVFIRDKTDSKEDYQQVFASTVLAVIKSLPSVTPKRKVGEWKKNERTFWTCSECGLVNKYNRVQYAYCPNCGTKMSESEG